MAVYHTFTTVRATPVDQTTVLAQLPPNAMPGEQQDTTVEGPGTFTYTFKKPTTWTVGQIAALQTVLDTAPAASPQRQAQGTIDQWPIELKALVLALIDQINVLRAGLTVPLPAVTPAQALAAIRNKAATL